MPLQFNKKELTPDEKKIQSVIDRIGDNKPTGFKNVEYKVERKHLPFMPIGCPPTMPQQNYATQIVHTPPPPPLSMPESKLRRCIVYGADQGGCYAWRLGYPAFLMKYTNKLVVNELSQMVVDPRFYIGIDSVTLQRQATPLQRAFSDFVKMGSMDLGYKLIYEIDDIVFEEDIPMYNPARDAFVDPVIRKNIEEIMRMSNEITVTCQYMKDYYIHKTGNKNVSVIPNYLPRFWFDNRYDREERLMNYEKNKNRPVVLYAGAGAHFDVRNKTNQTDDFTHVIKEIIATRKKYRWIFLGGVPVPLLPFVNSGEIEHRPWVPLLYLADAIKAVNANVCIAPLEDNVFNRAKSNIKLTESGALGIPCICQDLCTYAEADLKFRTGNEMIQQIDNCMKSADSYMRYSDRARAFADTMWLDTEANWMKRYEATVYKIGDVNRKYILETNPDQAQEISIKLPAVYEK